MGRLKRRKKKATNPSTVPVARESNKFVKPLDTKRLIEVLSRGVTALEASLFTQASLECERLNRLSSTLNLLESQLFDKDTLNSLSYKDKLVLYREARKTQETILTFLQHLHSMTLGAKDVISFVDALKRERERRMEASGDNGGGASTGELQRLKQLIVEVLLRKRVEEKQG